MGQPEERWRRFASRSPGFSARCFLLPDLLGARLTDSSSLQEHVGLIMKLAGQLKQLHETFPNCAAVADLLTA